MQTLNELIRALQQHPRIIGLVEYGSRTYTDIASDGDYDLLVLFSGYRPRVESLHFYMGATPIDLNLRCLEDRQAGQLPNSFDHMLIHGRLIYQSTPTVSSVLENLRQEHPSGNSLPVSEQVSARTRHGQKHVFDKIAGRYNERPTLCRFLLYSNLYWLIHGYFTVRGLPFHGEKWAFSYLMSNDPDILYIFEKIYTERDWTRQVELAYKLNERVLGPVGGMWQDGEALAFGTEKDVHLQRAGQEEFAYLFGDSIDAV